MKVAGRSPEELTRLVLGPTGSAVELLVLRGGEARSVILRRAALTPAGVALNASSATPRAQPHSDFARSAIGAPHNVGLLSGPPSQAPGQPDPRRTPGLEECGAEARSTAGAAPHAAQHSARAAPAPTRASVGRPVALVASPAYPAAPVLGAGRAHGAGVARPGAASSGEEAELDEAVLERLALQVAPETVRLRPKTSARPRPRCAWPCRLRRVPGARAPCAG